MRQYGSKKFFTQSIVSQTTNINNKLPNIGEIVSILVEPEIISYKIINTLSGVSCEGQKLTGKKAVLQIALNEKILYSSKLTDNSLHIAENKFFQSVYIVMPHEIEGTDIENLYYNKRLKPYVKADPVSIRKLRPRNIFQSINLLVNIKYIPTYQLCYTINSNSHQSNLYICYENGVNSQNLICNKFGQIIFPQWSPCGNFIAFLSNNFENFMLYIINIKNKIIKKVKVPDNIKTITSFCWCLNSVNIVFSAIAKINNILTKELFFIDINNLECTQLTDGKGIIKSYKPKCSPNKKEIAFLNFVNRSVNLCIKDFANMEFTQLTSLGNVKDFDWNKSGDSIAYICHTNLNSYDICLIKLNNLEIKTLFTCNCIGNKKKILFSPNSEFIAFICSDYSTEDIFLYSFKTSQTINLTKNYHNTKINDFEWKIDSTKIYYSQNVYGYFDIYSICIDDEFKYKLNTNTSCNTELNYRKKIL